MEVFNIKNNIVPIIGIIRVVILWILSPIIFGAGWFGGWILMKIVGGAMASGLNTLFGTTRFVPELIPVVCGALAVIGSFFKATVSSSNVMTK